MPLNDYYSDLMDQLDAAIFSGDLLETNLDELKEFLGRWNRESSAHTPFVAPQLKPSIHVKSCYPYKEWCNVTECNHCGRLGKYEDQHIANPCTACGGEVNKELVGRWVKDHWEIKE